MAQEPGADGLIAPLAKATSAGTLPALVAVALCFAGCGGGPADSASSAGTDTSAGTSASSAGSTVARAPDKAPVKARAEAARERAEKEASGSPEPGAPSGQGQKHGARLPRPKGAPEQAPSAEQAAQATVADLTLQSPAIVAAAGRPGRLAAAHTCDGKGSWPELHWSGVPAGTAELVLYVMNVQPVQGKLFVDWAVAGLDPGLEEIEAGELPKGAILGRNGFGKAGYEICPEGGGEIYMFAVYALPRRLAPPNGFDGREFRKEVLGVSGNVGLLPAVYERG